MGQAAWYAETEQQLRLAGAIPPGWRVHREGDDTVERLTLVAPSCGDGRLPPEVWLESCDDPEWIRWYGWGLDVGWEPNSGRARTAVEAVRAALHVL